MKPCLELHRCERGLLHGRATQFSPLGPLHHHHAHGSDSCPEDRTHTSAERQGQSSSARDTEHFRDEDIATFIGAEVPWIERADEVDHLE